VGVVKSLFTLPFIPSPARSCLAVAGGHQGRGILIMHTLHLAAEWFIPVLLKGYSGADVERFLGRNTSAVNRLTVSDELPEAVKYFKTFWNQRPLLRVERVLIV
jgi:hypothetical protein